jgi:hypothetical protein
MHAKGRKRNTRAVDDEISLHSFFRQHRLLLRGQTCALMCQKYVTKMGSDCAKNFRRLAILLEWNACQSET